MIYLAFNDPIPICERKTVIKNDLGYLNIDNYIHTVYQSVAVIGTGPIMPVL